MRLSFCRYLQHGVTLIEMMLVLAIIATLAGVVIPSYAEYQQRQTRHAATRHLIQLQAWVEQQFITTKHYPSVSDATDLEAKALCADCQLSPDYRFEIQSGEATYKILAHPRANHSQTDDPCATLVLYANGLITSTSSNASCPLPQDRAKNGVLQTLKRPA
ncbi:type IV pilin protein [Salinivibrio kushneri]|uniref:type IV pilin protein n=1 Tax=Salinivibrio kushneri TaxID=1908198 RepID=UPI000C844A87|nr:type IV pilin protein [Salinivibrio kushneri]